MPRFLLALVLSVVIAKPLELRIFNPEIDRILADEKRNEAIRIEGLFDLNIKKIDERTAGIKAETESLFNIRERLYQEYRCECDGACGTGKSGRGSECERKEQKYQQIDAEYQTLKTENDGLIAQLSGEMGQLNAWKQGEIDKQAALRSDGLLARLSAAQELPILPGFLIALFIFMLGIAPVLFKVLAQRGSYDEALRVLEETRLKINL